MKNVWKYRVIHQYIYYLINTKLMDLSDSFYSWLKMFWHPSLQDNDTQEHRDIFISYFEWHLNMSYLNTLNACGKRALNSHKALGKDACRMRWTCWKMTYIIITFICHTKYATNISLCSSALLFQVEFKMKRYTYAFRRFQKICGINITIDFWRLHFFIEWLKFFVGC